METEDSFITNLNTIKEMILDEEKLVTYISLSKELCIHVNSSKKLLSTSIRKIREGQPNIQLNVKYIISGSCGDNAAFTTVCTESELEKIRKRLNIIYFCHIYGVSKGCSGVDNAAFLILNRFADFSLCTGIIKSNECIKHTSDEIGNLKTNSQEVLVVENKPVPVSSKKLKKEPKSTFEAPNNGQVEETKSIKQKETEIKIKAEITSPKKESNINKPINHKSNGHKTQKGIASFFNKANGVQNRQMSNALTASNRDCKLIKTSCTEDLKMDVDEINSDFDQDIKKICKSVNEKINKETNFDEENKVVQKESKSYEKNKVLNKIKKSSKVDKKRKRVLHVSDSESDEEKDPFLDNLDVKQESDDEIPPTPSADNNIKITSGIINPKKRRKVVDKTYTDEDGYILTKKEEVYESCSENEDEIKINKEIKPMKEVKSETSPKAKTNSPKKAKKKISPPQKGKQPTLNNFFQKK